MKKLLVIFVWIFLYSNTFAFDFNLSNYQRFDENAWIQNIWNIILDTKEKEIKNFNLVISNNDYFIFDNYLDLISIDNWIWNYLLSSWNKKLYINLSNSFSWKLNISWIKARFYDEEIRDAKIGIDYDNDWIIDVYSTNYLDLEENNRYSDTMRPLPVSEVKYNLSNSGNTINLSWISSLDLDANSTLVTMKKNNEYGNFFEKSVYKNEKQELSYTWLDLSNNTYEISIFSKDNYYVTDKPFVIKLDKTNLVDLPTNSTGALETNTWTTVNTWTIINTEVVNISTWKINTEEKEIIIDKIIPIFKTKSFSDFMIVFDKKIDKREYKKEVRVVRNDIIKLLKDYEDKKITKIFVKKELKRLVWEFGKVW